MAPANKEVEIVATHFYEFDHGQTVEELVPADWELKPGDLVRWGCAQFSGLADVVNCSTRGDKIACTLRKVY